MSDIAKKTLPPGSWPGSKGAKTAETAPSESAAAPRSAASPPTLDGGKTKDKDAAPSEDSESYSDGAGNYTHEKEETEGEERRLDDIEEDSQEGQIQMTDTEDHLQQSLKQVPPQPESEQQEQNGVDESVDEQDIKTATDEGQPEESVADTEAKTATTDKAGPAPIEPEQGESHIQDEAEAGTETVDDDTVAEPTEVDQGEEQAGSTMSSELTEQAKEAFDQASENQPTSEARESFLKSAKNNLSAASGITKLTGKKSQKSQPQTERTATEAPQVEGSQKQPTEFQDQVDDLPEETVSGLDQDEQQLGTAPTATARSRTERGGGTQPAETVTGKTATQQFEGAPTEAGTQRSRARFDMQSEQAPTELGSQDQEQYETQTQTQTQTQPQEGTRIEGSQLPTSQVEGSQFQQEGTQVGGSQLQGSQLQDSQLEGSQLQQEGSQQPPPQTTYDSGTVPEQLDFSVLRNGTVNKGGNVVNEDGKVVGRVVQGILMYLIGKKVDENGDIWSENGKVIGKAEPVSDSERDDMLKEPAPFESFPDAVVDGNGMVVSNGEWVGKVIEGDLKVLRGRPVDPDGDILDKGGNVIGKAERWEPEPEPEAEPEPEIDRSILAGKRVNKAGNVVDGSGVIFGRVVEGDPKKMVGRMCDKNGNILSESGDVLGRAEVVSEGEREGFKEGPFAELEGCTVAKDGTVVTPSGDIVGRLIKGDGKILFGRAVDEDGDVLDRNGNVLGKAERWEPEEKEVRKNPMMGRRVNREGNVVDEDGNIVGKLTSGDLSICSGKEIDEDGDVVDHKGTVIGHCSLLEDIPKVEEEAESPEDKEKREQAERDKKLAIQMAVCIEQCLDKIRPICKMITEKIDKAERTPEDERDEEQLVREVRPLIEEGGRILQEAQGIIKGLDPDGRISANAKHKTAAREATPEEYHLADVLKDLTGDVTQCIENAKRKLEDMPHAKKELNPLWGLLNEPLFQILAAVGLLLSGVLGLVGRLLSGLGLGGLLDGLLGTLGINRVLGALGVGSITGGGKKKKSGGLLGGILGG